jgi:hypothetical protein
MLPETSLWLNCIRFKTDILPLLCHFLKDSVYKYIKHMHFGIWVTVQNVVQHVSLRQKYNL